MIDTARTATPAQSAASTKALHSMDTIRSLTLSEQVSLLSGADFWHTQDLPTAGIPGFHLADGPHGLRTQQDAGDHLGVGTSIQATCFPPAVTLASTWNDTLAAEVGRAVGIEALALGVDVVLGPGMNIKRHPLGGRNFEYFSEDPLLSGRLATAMVTGIQSTGVGACLKHYAVNNQESHRFVVDAVVDERTLRELYLAGFEHAVTMSRPVAVMAAYNKVNGVPAAAHPQLLGTILRGDWGFEGLVVSDWGGSGDRVAALAAGLDLEMPGSHGLFDHEILDAVRTGSLAPEIVETSARRVASLAAASPSAAAKRGPGQGAASSSLPVDAHDQLATRVAAEGSVLLTNDGVLPLEGTETVALIGAFAEHPRFQGNGSSVVTPTRVTTLREALGARRALVTYAPGYDPARSVRDDRLIEQAVAAARDADVAVVMVGLPGTVESEGFDRDDLHLPTQHDALVAAVCAANPRTVVVLSNGAPVLMPWKDDVAAILECYLGGQASGAALAAVLHGDLEPAGRLAETFPARRSDVAADPWFPGTPRQVQYREGLFVGYRHHVTTGIAPLFAFGHGLSYTRFAWTDPSIDRRDLGPGEPLTVTVTVTNTGERAGSDVVQVYLADRTGAVLRPAHQLAGYTKVHLQPGEARTVEVAVPARAFAFYDVATAQWRTPDGPHEVLVARSSERIEHSLSVTVHGGVTTRGDDHRSAPVAADDAAFERRLGRPLPAEHPVRPFSRESTIEELAVHPLGRALRRVLVRASPVGDLDAMDEVTRLMFERSIAELPFRSAAMFSGGRIRLPAVDAVLALANGDVRSLVTLTRPAAERVVGGVGSTIGRAVARTRRRGNP